MNLDNNKIGDTNNSNTNSNELRPRKWLLIVFIVISIIIVIILANKFVGDRKENSNNRNFWEIFDIFDIFNGIEKKAFNSNFEFYSGTKIGTMVSELLDEVITNNKTNSDHTIVVVFGDKSTSNTDEIKNMKNDLAILNKYEISIDYDENGYANKIVIEANSNIDDIFNKDDIETSIFNGKFELYSGTQSGFFVSNLLDAVITNNKTNSNHVLSVVYDTTDTTDENEIRSLKTKFDSFTNYEVILNYDELGFISKIVIED